MILLASCAPKTWQFADAKMDKLYVQKSSSKNDDGIEKILAPYKREVDAEMNDVIGNVVRTMKKKRPECELGNWMSDAMMYAAQKASDLEIDFAVQNYGGIRVPEIPKGPLTVGKVYELMPFDNFLVIVTVDKATMTAFANRLAESSGWPVSKEVRLVAKGGQLVSLKINDKDWQEKDEYVIALPDYVANGGSDCDFFIDAPRESYDLLIRDILIDYLKNVSSELDYKIEGRTVVTK